MTPEQELLRKVRLQKLIEMQQSGAVPVQPQPPVPAPIDATAGTALSNRAAALEQQAQPAPGPQGIGNKLVAGLQGFSEAFANPHGYPQYNLERQQMEQQRQQQLLTKAQQLREQAQQQNNFETQQQRLNENTASERAYQQGQLEQTKRLRDLEQEKFNYEKSKPNDANIPAGATRIRTDATGSVTPLYTAPTPTKPEAVPNTPFEVWRTQHPNDPVENWVKLNKTDPAAKEPNSPFEVWRSQHPNEPIENWMELNRQNTRPVSEGERNAFRFYERMSGAENDISQVEDAISKLGTIGQAGLNYLPNVLQSSTNQRYQQAQRAFTEARLRKDSGAAIPQQEFENDRRMYFVQPGDGPEVIAQKKAARAIAIEGLRKSAGRAYEETYGVLPGKSPAPPAPSAKPESTGSPETKIINGILYEKVQGGWQRKKQ